MNTNENVRDVNILHHVGLVASNMSALTDCYEKLGFKLSPLSMPKVPLTHGGKPEMLGAGNRCAIFENNYLELLGVVDKERWSKITKAQRGPYDIDIPLSRYEGLHIMHFGTDDIETTRARLIKQGIPASEITPFQRNVDTPDGERTMYAKSLHFPYENDPEALIQIAQHLTPELVFLPNYMHHPNGAKRITEIVVCVNEPEKYVDKYVAYTGHGRKKVENHYLINLGFSKIIVAAPEFIEEIIPDSKPPVVPFLAGFTVMVSDLNATRKLLDTNHISYLEYNERVIVPASEAYGCAVIFES